MHRQHSGLIISAWVNHPLMKTVILLVYAAIEKMSVRGELSTVQCKQNLKISVENWLSIFFTNTKCIQQTSQSKQKTKTKQNITLY